MLNGVKMNVFELDLLLLPVNAGNTHWFLVIIRPRKGTIEVFDSMTGGTYETVCAPCLSP